MTLRFDEIKEVKAVKKKLSIIKNTDEEIRHAFEIYSKNNPNLNKDGICTMIAEETGKGTRTIWRIINNDPEPPKRAIITF